MNSVANLGENLKSLGGEDSTKIGEMFTKINESVNTLDLSKLNKLNDLAYNLSKFAEHMNGSFDDLVDVLEKLKEVVEGMNVDVSIEGGGNTTPALAPVAAPTNISSPSKETIDITPIVSQLSAIYEQLAGGIEVEPKGDSFLAR